MDVVFGAELFVRASMVHIIAKVLSYRTLHLVHPPTHKRMVNQRLPSFLFSTYHLIF